MKFWVGVIKITLGFQFHLFTIILVNNLNRLIPYTVGTIIHFTKSLTQSIIECNNIRQYFFLMSKYLLVYYIPAQGQKCTVI